MKSKVILSLTLYFTLVGCGQDNHPDQNQQQQQQQQQITDNSQHKNYSSHSANNIQTQTVISLKEDSLSRIELAQAEQQAITNDLSGLNDNSTSSSPPVNEMSGGTRIPETSSSNITALPNSDIPPSDPSSPTTPGVPPTAKTPLPDSPPPSNPPPPSSDSNTLGVGNASSHQFKGNLDNLPKPVIISPPDSGTNSSKKSSSLSIEKPLAENLSSQSPTVESGLKEKNTEQPPVTIQLMERKAEQAPQSFLAEIKALKQEIKDLKQWAYNK